MEHVTEELLNEFIEDLKLLGSFEVANTFEVSVSAVINNAKDKGLVAPSFSRQHNLLSIASRSFHS